MNKVLLVGATSLILFGVSGGVSYYLRSRNQPTTSEEPHAKGPASKVGLDAAHAHGGQADEDLRAAVRPAYNSGTEEIARLTGELRTRVAAARENERQTGARKKQLELIQQDLRSERAAIDDLRKQVKKELEAVQGAFADLERRKASMNSEQRKASQTAKELEGRTVRMQKEDYENLKKLALVANSMPAESASEMMRNLANTGKMDTAVQLLGLMQERQAAKVLAVLGDAGLAAQLLEKLKGLRRPTPLPALGAMSGGGGR